MSLREKGPLCSAATTAANGSAVVTLLASVVWGASGSSWPLALQVSELTLPDSAMMPAREAARGRWQQ
jgi:hypothetical protein